MTRTEAAQICQSVKFILENSDYTEAVEEALNMAIEALEQEPTAEYSSDVISRQGAIDAICEDGTMFERQGQYSMTMAERKQRDADILDALPSAQPFTSEQIQIMQELEAAQVEKAYELGKADRPKWIPCSKRLPEEGDVVLICSKSGVIDFGKRKGDKWVWLAEALWDYWQETEDLIAWMPLPEAYREDEQ